MKKPYKPSADRFLSDDPEENKKLIHKLRKKGPPGVDIDEKIDPEEFEKHQKMLKKRQERRKKEKGKRYE
jgi:hypothetical protein